MSSDQENAEPFDYFRDIWEHRPRMTYEDISLVFDADGGLVIENRDGTEILGQATIPAWQLDLVLEFIKQHRLSPMQTAANPRARKGKTSS